MYSLFEKNRTDYRCSYAARSYRYFEKPCADVKGNKEELTTRIGCYVYVFSHQMFAVGRINKLLRKYFGVTFW